MLGAELPAGVRFQDGGTCHRGLDASGGWGKPQPTWGCGEVMTHIFSVEVTGWGRGARGDSRLVAPRGGEAALCPHLGFSFLKDQGLPSSAIFTLCRAWALGLRLWP